MADKKQVKILDPEKQERIRKQKQRHLNRIRVRASVIRMLSLVLIVMLCGRIMFIKVVHGEDWEKSAVIQQTTQENEQTLTANRGDILDRTGKSLAISTSVYTVFADVHVINEQNELSKEKTLINETAAAMEELLGYPASDFKAAFAKDETGALIKDTYYFVLKKEVPLDIATQIEDRNLLGIHLEEVGKRVYPYNNVAAQTIGFIGGDGKYSNWGLENYYDTELTGIDGRYFVSYDDNKNVRKYEVEPIKGNTLVTTLDATMQQFSDELVDKYGIQHGAKNASIIIMKPNTGEIVAMSEYPRFDSNFPGKLELVTDPTFATTYDTLDDTEKGESIYKLWKNFNVSNTFEPGSIFKPVTVAAALEEGIIANDDVFYCNGYNTYQDGTRVKCWIYDSTGGGHGKQTVEEALANSCNVAMMEIGEKTGAEVFSKYQKDFGFGVKTGVDLPGEEDGIVYDASGLNEVELGTGSFGQGFNATTLQSLVAFNATINGGKIVKPYVVADILDSTGKVIFHKEPEVLRQVVSKLTSDIIRNDLKATMIYGTGKNLAISGYSIGGKTGTAEQVPRGSGKYALSFVGYIPVNNPQYIAIGVINEPNDYLEKHTSAVPMMKEVFEKLIKYYNIPSDSDVIANNTGNKTFMKDYTGDVKIAVQDINAKGYNFDISGSGDYVYKQLPNKDQPIDSNTTVILFVKESENLDPTTLVEVPNVVGLTLDQARTTLIEFGFEVVENQETSTKTVEVETVAPTTLVDEQPEEMPVYEVTKQMPNKGISLPKGTQIRLNYK